MSGDFLSYIYVIPALLIAWWYLRRRKLAERKSVHALRTATESGLLEPPSLHPVVDPNICIGCGSCVAACPEQPQHAVLGMIANKARLVAPSDCIGHGACKTSCPVNAISLVFGTETRGVDIPTISPSFETNVRGIFIAGELGGMGLIRNAIEQGRQAMDSVAALLEPGHNNDHDVVIVGAGPAGFSATLAAKLARIRSVTLEQESLGGTVSHYPRGKLVMTQPAMLPIIGKMQFRNVQKEDLLEFWTEAERRSGVTITYHERVESIERNSGTHGFTVTTSRRKYDTRAVLLAIGRRGTPRQLGVPGEELSKVVYRLVDTQQYRHKHVLIVGGGDSALEAATTIADEPGSVVTLSYRSSAFSRAKPGNRERIEVMMQNSQLDVIFESEVQRIDPERVLINTADGITEIQNDAVIISAGGILPTTFLRSAGIDVETKWGTA